MKYKVVYHEKLGLNDTFTIDMFKKPKSLERKKRCGRHFEALNDEISTSF